MIELLDERIAPLEAELAPLAQADARVQLLRTIPGLGSLLALTVEVEIAEIARFPSAAKLVGYSGLLPRVHQSGESSRTGRLTKAGSPLLRWAAVEAAQQGWRPQNPWHRLYVDIRRRQGNGNAAKAAVGAQGADRLLARARPQGSLQACCLGSADRPGKLLHFPGRLTAHLRIEKPGQLQADTLRHERRKRSQLTRSQQRGEASNRDPGLTRGP